MAKPRRHSGEFKLDYAAHLNGCPTSSLRSMPYGLTPEARSYVLDVVSLWQPKSVLDPWAGVGDLAYEAHSRLTCQRVLALTEVMPDAETPLPTKTGGAVSIQIGNPLEILAANNELFDAAIGCPPASVGLKQVASDADTHDGMTDDYGMRLLVHACSRLTDKGVGVFVVPTSVATRPFRHAAQRTALQRMGITAVTAIDLPPRMLATSGIDTQLVLFARSNEPEILAGRWTNTPELRAMLLDSIRSRMSSKVARLVPRDGFRGYKAIEIRDSLKRLAKQMGFVETPCADIFSVINTLPRDADSFPPIDNAVYLPTSSHMPATTGQPEASGRSKKLLQLVVNPDVVDAEYLALLLNSPLGHLWRDSISQGEHVATIGLDLLKASSLFLPPAGNRDISLKTRECLHHISTLRNELAELEQSLWRTPLAVDDVRLAVKRVNIQDRFGAWLESLPFPLASILWLGLTADRGVDARVKHKLHFFEALGHFLGTVHLSAFAAHHPDWPAIHERLSTTLAKAHLSFERSTFGTWKNTCEVLSSQSRELWKKDEDSLFRLYRTRNRGVLRMLTSAALVKAIADSNSMRNDFDGHGGVRSARVSEKLSNDLDHLIDVARSEVGEHWQEYRLIKPHAFRYTNGEYVGTVKVVMGSRTPFLSVETTTAEPMEDGVLHLKDSSYDRPLRLLPLFKVMPSPRTEENACYFFNRLQDPGVRMVSYHYESEGEVTAALADVSDAIKNLLTS